VTRYVGLLRAINVGSGRTVRMADLRALLESAGCRNVATYVQSGNVVFDHTASAAKLEQDLETRIAKLAGFAVPVMLRTAREWAAIVGDNPYAALDESKLHVACFKKAPPAATITKLEGAVAGDEQFAVRGRDVYVHLPNGVGRSKLAAAFGALPAPATVRNWRTARKLDELARTVA
jgi:uncharacterized protein (DUF1697 family)